MRKYLQFFLPYVDVLNHELKIIQSFVAMFLDLDPASRPSAEAAYNHKFLGVGNYRPPVGRIWRKKLVNYKDIDTLVTAFNSPGVLRGLDDITGTHTFRLKSPNAEYKFTTLSDSPPDSQGREESQPPEDVASETAEADLEAVGDVGETEEAPLSANSLKRFLPAYDFERDPEHLPPQISGQGNNDLRVTDPNEPESALTFRVLDQNGGKVVISLPVNQLDNAQECVRVSEDEGSGRDVSPSPAEEHHVSGTQGPPRRKKKLSRLVAWIRKKLSI